MSVNAEVAEVMKQVRQRTVLIIEVKGDRDAACKLLEQHDAVESVDVKKDQLHVTLQQGVEDYSEIPSLLIQAGHKLTLFREEEVNLESAFMTLTKGTGAKI